jgi:hypothetical protein
VSFTFTDCLKYKKCFFTKSIYPHGLECAAVFGKKQHDVIPHPPYSPDLVPCDFFLFPHMKRQMKGKHSADVSEVKKKTQH